VSTLNLHVTYRPLRLGWCVRRGNWTHLHNALRLTHTLWGGRYNPIIITDDDYGFSEQFIRLYRIDSLMSVGENDAELQDFVARFPWLPWPGFQRLLFSEGGGRPEPQLLDVSSPLHVIRGLHLDGVQRARLRATLIFWDEEDPLAAVWHATFGGYPNPEELGLDYGRAFAEVLYADRRRLSQDQPIPADSHRLFTPSELTAYDLIPDRSPSWGRGGFYYGSADNFDDIVTYWNLRAAGLDLLFYDPQHEQRFVDVVERLRQLFDAPEPELERVQPPPVLYYRPGNEPAEVASFGARVLRSSVTEATWNGLNLRPSLPQFRYRSALGSVTGSHGRYTVSLTLPDKPYPRDPDSGRQQLVATVRPVTDLPDENSTIRVPHLPKLNKYFGREVILGPNRLRAGVGGAGVILNSSTEDLRLFSLGSRDLVRNIFEAYGIKAEPSQAGLIGARLIQQMGGLQGCRAFKISGVRNLIERYSPTQSFTRSAAITTIGALDPATGRPDFERYQDLYLDPEQRGKLQPAGAFDYLLKKAVFRVGLSFTCPNCELEFWMPLDHAGSVAECEFCGQHFPVAVQLKDRDWRFRRSGLFGREDNQEGSVPVALTLQQLHTNFSSISQEWVAYTTAMKLEPVGAVINRCETDFVVVTQGHDGRVQLLIGECKTRDEITDQDVANLGRVADSISDKDLDVFIVFSKLADFREEEIERCRRADRDYSPRVIMLTPRELESYYLYEETEKAFEINPYTLRPADLAQVTRDVFLDPKPRVSDGG
jgi:hypothetical protein